MSELLEELWESLSQESDPLPLTAEQEVELDRRLDGLDREGAVGISAEELRERIRNRSSSTAAAKATKLAADVRDE